MANPQHSRPSTYPPVTGNTEGASGFVTRDSVVGLYSDETGPAKDPELDRVTFDDQVPSGSTVKAPIQGLPFIVQHENNEHEKINQQLGGSDAVANSLLSLTSNSPEGSSDNELGNGVSPTQQTSSICQIQSDHESPEIAMDPTVAPPQAWRDATNQMSEPVSDVQSPNSAAFDINGSFGGISGPVTVAQPASTLTSDGAIPASSTGLGESSTHPSSASNSMPPPAAPASLLGSLRPSRKAKSAVHQIKDLAIGPRLASSAVILFRLGRANEAKAIGQFAIDLCGKDIWDEYLPHYMEHPRLDDDDDANAIRLLQDVVAFLNGVDPVSSAFLGGIVSLMTG